MKILKSGRPALSDLLNEKFNGKYEDEIICAPLFYRIDVDCNLIPGMVSLSVYCAGDGFCCDPHALSLPKCKAKYSIFDVMRKKAQILSGLGRQSVGIVFLGANPCSIEKLYKIFYYFRSRYISIFTDGSDVVRARWPNNVYGVNLIVKHSSEVEYLSTYYESMLVSMSAMSNIKNKRIVARYTKDTRKEIMETAEILQRLEKGWNIVEFDCGK